MRAVRFFLPRPSARRCSRPRPTFPKARVRSCSYPPPMLSSQPRSAGGVCDVQSDGRQTAQLFGIRLAPNGIAVYEVPPMTDVAQSRFDTLLVEGLTPSTAGAGPRLSDARSRPWPWVNFPSQRAPQFRSMVECTSTNTEPESRTRRTTKTINTVQRSPSTGRDQSNFGGDGDGKRHI